LVREVRQAVVLAGGRGTRLRPLTSNRPKPLLPVLGRPCIEYILTALDEAGIEEIFIACGYRATDLVEALGDETPGGTGLIFAFEDEPAGTAGAVKLLESRIDGTFVVASGDVLADVDMRALIDYHGSKGAFATMALTTVERPEEFGVVGLDENGRIERFKEKPSTREVFSNLVNAGIYILKREALDHVPEGEMFDFSKNLFPLLLEMDKPLFGAPLQGMWKDIGRPSDLIEANIEMASRRGASHQGRHLTPPVYLGKNTVLGEGTTVGGSVLGDSVIVGEECRVEGSLLMDSSGVGDGCLIQECALGEGCVVGEGARLVGCVLGDGVEVPPGSRLEGENLES